MRTVFAAFAVALGVAASAPAQAAYVVDIVDTGSGLVATGSGSFDLSGLTFLSNGDGINETFPDEGAIAIGAGSSHPFGDLYGGVIGPSAFGTGYVFGAETENGPFIQLVGDLGRLQVPTGYVSGTLLAASQDTYTGSFASLGLTVGTYVWTLGQGPGADTFTLNIGVVPEPETWGLLILGAAMSGAALRRRRPRPALA